MHIKLLAGGRKCMKYPQLSAIFASSSLLFLVRLSEPVGVSEVDRPWILHCPISSSGMFGEFSFSLIEI